LILVDTIFKHLFCDEDYTRTVLPHLKREYYEDQTHMVVFDIFEKFFDNYNKIPNEQVVLLELDNANLSEDVYNESKSFVRRIKDTELVETQFALDTTEQWCKDRSLYIAISESIMIADGESKNLSRGQIPELLKNALAISFDSQIGLDVINDAEKKHELYTNSEYKYPFDLEKLNIYTENGIPAKTLNVISGSSGTGKTIFMCHLAVEYMRQGRNVLYITLEMAEERITERLDANLLGVRMDSLKNIDKDKYCSKVNDIQKKFTGNIVVKEFPTGGANVNNIRFILNELKNKKDFIPEVIIVDYLNIMASSRVKDSSANSYTVVKSIAEELRGLAVETKTLVWTGTQLGRAAHQNTDASMTDVSDSFGTVMTADTMFGIIKTPDLDEMGQQLIKIFKNRFGPIDKSFCVGIDYEHMRYSDIKDNSVSQPATQAAIAQSPQLDPIEGFVF